MGKLKDSVQKQEQNSNRGILIGIIATLTIMLALESILLAYQFKDNSNDSRNVKEQVKSDEEELDEEENEPETVNELRICTDEEIIQYFAEAFGSYLEQSFEIDEEITLTQECHFKPYDFLQNELYRLEVFLDPGFGQVNNVVFGSTKSISPVYSETRFYFTHVNTDTGFGTVLASYSPFDQKYSVIHTFEESMLWIYKMELMGETLLMDGGLVSTGCEDRESCEALELELNSFYENDPGGIYIFNDKIGEVRHVYVEELE